MEKAYMNHLAKANLCKIKEESKIHFVLTNILLLDFRFDHYRIRWNPISANSLDIFINSRSFSEYQFRDGYRYRTL